MAQQQNVNERMKEKKKLDLERVIEMNQSKPNQTNKKLGDVAKMAKQKDPELTFHRHTKIITIYRTRFDEKKNESWQKDNPQLTI